MRVVKSDNIELSPRMKQSVRQKSRKKMSSVLLIVFYIVSHLHATNMGLMFHDVCMVCTPNLTKQNDEILS